MKYAVAVLTLASFGTMFAADKPADTTAPTAKAKKHRKHHSKKADAATTAPAAK